MDIYRINRITSSDINKISHNNNNNNQYYKSIASTGSVIGDAVTAPLQFLRKQVTWSTDDRLIQDDSPSQEENIFSYYYHSLLSIKFTSLDEQRANQNFVGSRAQSLLQSVHQTTTSSVSTATTSNQEKYISYLNYYYLSNYQQNIIYLNNLILAIIILFVLFSVLILLEENDSFYNLSAITYLLLITFNLIIIIFAHNLAKQFLVYNRTFV